MTDYERLLRTASAVAPFETFEELLTSRDGFRLTTPSALQLAICRVIDGRPLGDTWDDPEVRQAFGNVAPLVPEAGLEELLLLSGIRTGKSLIAAAAAVYATQTCSLEPAPGVKLGMGEVPRVSVVSVSKDLANVVFSHIAGNVLASAYLKTLLLDEPTSDSLLLRHPSGRPMEIKVVAGSRSGSTLIARWSAGVVFDEAPRMLGQDEGVVNLEEMRGAVRFRLLRNARIWYIGSPYAPQGPTYKMREENWGKADAKVLTIKAPANVMNPKLWTPEKVAAYRAQDPEVARTDIDAEYASPEIQLFSETLVKGCTRAEPATLPVEEGCDYVAAMDPATRKNIWTLTIVTRSRGKIRQVGAWQWKPTSSEPLSPKAVMAEVADICRAYRVYKLKSDQWSADAIRDIAIELDLPFVQEDMLGAARTRSWLSLARRMEAGLVELCPDPDVRADLMRVKRRPKGDGGVVIVLPQTQDGRHVDYAPALVSAASEYLEDPMDRPPAPEKRSAFDDSVIEDMEDRAYRAEVTGEDEDDDEFWQEAVDW